MIVENADNRVINLHSARFNVITQISDLCFQLARDKGWHDTPRDPLSVMALVHSEISEAVEELRRGTPMVDYPGKGGKPEGYGVELADAMIRIMDFCGSEGIPIGRLIEKKLKYNMTRPYKHGKEK
jgi:NTP pyrophosphatase (non-canonical NTP hydrolase)